MADEPTATAPGAMSSVLPGDASDPEFRVPVKGFRG